MKVAYSRNIGDNEVVIMCGYVGDNKCVVLIKDKDKKIIQDFGDMSKEKAFEVYNNQKENDITLIKLINFLELLTTYERNIYVSNGAKELLPVLKDMRKDLK